jgi:PAS domain S-box-containing protein
MVSPFWLGNVVLVAVLLLVRRTLWAPVLVAGLAGFFLFDVQTGVPIRSIGWLILSNLVEVLTAALCLGHSFDGVPRLNSLKALAKYSVYAVFLAPFLGAFLGALSAESNYWASWKMAFLSEALGFLILMPAILGWARDIPAWVRRPRTYYMEATALLVVLVILGSLAFAGIGKSSPALLYSLVPLLLWSTLRFGSTGVSTSMVAIAFVSIWGAIHGRGPFSEPGGIGGVLSLQLFLLVTGAPFIFLAALADERKQAEEKLKASEEHSRQLVQGSSVAMIVSRGLEQKVELMNDSFTALFGYTMDDVPDVAHWWPLAYPEEEYRRTVRTEWQARVEKAIRNGTEIEPMEAAVRCKDGSTRYIEARLSCIGETNLVTLIDLTGRKRAEHSLRESEERFRLVANTAPVLIWMSGTDKLCSYFNQPWLEFTGRPVEAELGNGWADGVHPDDFKSCMDKYTQAFDRREKFAMEYRLRRYDGEYRWLADIGVPRFMPDGSFAGYIGSCIDVTDRRLAEDALTEVGRRLIEAHEEERTWIARELHDDVNQRIALLAIELERCNQQLPDSALDFHDHIRNALQRILDISKDIQALSHRLHSSKLEYLGLVAAVNTFCKELSEQREVAIDFSHSGVPSNLPKEISLCLFRVLQEGLQNAVKHSGERHFKVELQGTSEEIQLTVNDEGVGFDPQDAMNRRGLGLISMRERLQLVRGKFSIKSQPGVGTAINARVPFNSSSDSGPMAG